MPFLPDEYVYTGQHNCFYVIHRSALVLSVFLDCNLRYRPGAPDRSILGSVAHPSINDQKSDLAETSKPVTG